MVSPPGRVQSFASGPVVLLSPSWLAFSFWLGIASALCVPWNSCSSLPRVLSPVSGPTLREQSEHPQRAPDPLVFTPVNRPPCHAFCPGRLRTPFPLAQFWCGSRSSPSAVQEVPQYLLSAAPAVNFPGNDLRDLPQITRTRSWPLSFPSFPFFSFPFFPFLPFFWEDSLRQSAAEHVHLLSCSACAPCLVQGRCNGPGPARWWQGSQQWYRVLEYHC